MKSDREIIGDYLKGLRSCLDEIAEKDIIEIVDIIMKACSDGKKVIFMGNGGSAATSSHFVNDLGKGASVQGKAPFKAISLVDNVPLIMALANDEGYEMIFVGQLKAVLNEGDVVVGISASGDSPNVVKAVEYANEIGAKTVGITGFSGGRLKKIVQLSVHIETLDGEYGPVEDIHMILDHLVTTYLRMKIEVGDKF